MNDLTFNGAKKARSEGATLALRNDTFGRSDPEDARKNCVVYVFNWPSAVHVRQSGRVTVDEARELLALPAVWWVGSQPL